MGVKPPQQFSEYIFRKLNQNLEQVKNAAFFVVFYYFTAPRSQYSTDSGEFIIYIHISKCFIYAFYSFIIWMDADICN